MRWERHHFEKKESIVTFLCKSQYIRIGQKSLLNSRRILENYIQKNPEFATTHLPFRPSKDAPELIRRMCKNAEKVNVGPMAAVAGTLAEESLKAILGAGAKEAVVDNGGDIALFIQKPVNIGIFAGNSPISELAFEVNPRDEPFGICTSSGTVGHSFSYGKADAAVVVSSNIGLADAAATALGNRVKGEEDLNGCFNFLEEVPEIEGALVIYHDRIALWGELPRLIKSRVDVNLITRGEIVKNRRKVL